MQRKVSDIVTDLELLVHGYGAETAAAVARARLRRLGGELREYSPEPGDRPAVDARGVQINEARFEWLRRQQDLIAALADEISAIALEPCAELRLAETHSGLSAICEHRDPELRELVASLARRRQQLLDNLGHDRKRLDAGVHEAELSNAAGSASEAAANADEICKNSLDRGDGEMF